MCKDVVSYKLIETEIVNRASLFIRNRLLAGIYIATKRISRGFPQELLLGFVSQFQFSINF